MSVTEIAHEVGYGSYKTFSRIFRESKGIVTLRTVCANQSGEVVVDGEAVLLVPGPA